MSILAAEAPSGHEAISLCGSSFCNINYQTLISSAIAIVITTLFGLYVARTLQSGRPSKLQMVFELFLDYVRGLVGDTVSREGTDFIIPLAATIGFYVLVANWLDFLPLTNPVEPAASDVNQTAALGILVFLAAQVYSVKVLGVKGSLRRFTKPFEMPLFVRILFVPLNIIGHGVPAGTALRSRRGRRLACLLRCLRRPAADRLEVLRRLLRRDHPGLHLHAADRHLLRTGAGGARGGGAPRRRPLPAQSRLTI
jgi:hypothetical protein